MLEPMELDRLGEACEQVRPGRCERELARALGARAHLAGDEDARWRRGRDDARGQVDRGSEEVAPQCGDLAGGESDADRWRDRRVAKGVDEVERDPARRCGSAPQRR